MLTKTFDVSVIPAVKGHPAQPASHSCPPPKPPVHTGSGGGSTGGPGNGGPVVCLVYTGPPLPPDSSIITCLPAAGP